MIQHLDWQEQTAINCYKPCRIRCGFSIVQTLLKTLKAVLIRRRT
nr:MAG TPA: hypothetical protein [Caudoviricetes sp.]